MKKSFYAFLVLLGLCMAESANAGRWDFWFRSLFGGARVYGPFLCNNGCNITEETNGLPVGAYLTIEGGVTTWLKANPPPQDDKSGRWKPGDSATICDGTNCVTLVWVPASSMFSLVTLPFKDAKLYKNQKTAATGGPSTAGSYQLNLQGHWEHTDFYQHYDDGTSRLYHTESKFIVDYIGFDAVTGSRGLPRIKVY